MKLIVSEIDYSEAKECLGHSLRILYQLRDEHIKSLIPELLAQAILITSEWPQEMLRDCQSLIDSAKSSK